MKEIFLLIIVTAVSLSGCVSKTTTYTKETKTDGTVIETTVTESDGSLLTEKTFVTAGNLQGVKIETTGSTSTGTLLPNFFMGGGNSIVLSSPGNDDRPVFCYSRSISLLGSLTNGEASGISFAYKGVKGETAEQTQKRIITLKSLSEQSLSE